MPSGEALEELLQPAGLDGSSCDASPPIDVEVHRVLEAGSSLRLIDDSDAALLRGVYADGMTGDQAARRFHTSAGVVRVRCSKARAAAGGICSRTGHTRPDRRPLTFPRERQPPNPACLDRFSSGSRPKLRTGSANEAASPRASSACAMCTTEPSAIADPTLELWATEAVKKVDLLTCRGLRVIAVGIADRYSVLAVPSLGGSCHIEKRAGEAQGLIHCSRLSYQQVPGLLEGLTSSPSRLGSLLQALQHLSHGS